MAVMMSHDQERGGTSRPRSGTSSRRACEAPIACCVGR